MATEQTAAAALHRTDDALSVASTSDSKGESISSAAAGSFTGTQPLDIPVEVGEDNIPGTKDDFLLYGIVLFDTSLELKRLDMCVQRGFVYNVRNMSKEFRCWKPKSTS